MVADRALWSLGPVLVVVPTLRLGGSSLGGLANPAWLCALAVVFATVRGGLASGLCAAAVSAAAVGLDIAGEHPGVAVSCGDWLPRLALASLWFSSLVLAVAAGRFGRMSGRGKDASRLRLLLEQSRDGIVVLDSRGQVCDVNRRFAEMLGYTAEELGRLHVWDFDALLDRSQIEARLNGRGRDGDLFHTRHRRKDGTEYDAEVSASAAYDGGRRLILCVCRDISWRIEAERSLRDGEARYRALMETTPDGFYVTDPMGRFLEVNDAYVRLSGYSHEELRSMRISDVDFRESAEETERHRSRIRESGYDCFESLHRARDGRLWAVECNVSYWPGKGGIFFTFLRDITQRNALQTELRRWADAFESCAHGIALGDPETSRILACNSAYARLQGRKSGDLTGADILSLYAPADLEWVKTRIEESDRVGQVAYEARLLHCDGSLIPVQIDLVSVRDDRGRLLHRVATVQDIRERKRAQQRLLDSELRLRKLGDNLPDSCLYQYMRCPDGTARFVYMSAGAERVTGVKIEDAMRDAQLLFGLVEPESLPALLEGEAVSARDLSIFDMELPIRRADGQHRWVRLRSQPRSLPGGETLWDGVLMDITELKLAEAEIRGLNASLERMVAERTAEVDSMLANATVGLAFANRKYECIRINQYLADIDGIPVEQHIGRKLCELLPHASSFIESDLERVFETGRPISGRELALQNPVRPWETRYLVLGHFPVLHADGSVRSVGTSVTDVTTRIRSEKTQAELNRTLQAEITQRAELEARIRMLATVFEATSDFVGIADPSHRVIYLNRAFSEALGRWHDREQLTVSDCHPQASLQTIESEALPAAERGEVWCGETQFQYLDGRVIPMSQIVLAHRDEDGALQFYATIMRDISGRRQMEGMLRRHSEELLEANCLLARASRLKDEFLASMSHELRTPLNGILALSQSLLDEVYGPIDPRQRRAMLDVEDCGRHLLALINDILDVAKIEAGKIELHTGALDVGEVVQASLRLVKEAAIRKRISISFSLDGAPGRLLADQLRVKQVLVNLLSNAVKFTNESGKVGIDVTGDPSRKEVRFTVWDTGIGISREDQGRLFQPFIQLDSGLARKYEGTGLGLVLVKRLTELHGGRLELESEPGKGSRFTVVIPWVEYGAQALSADRNLPPETAGKPAQIATPDPPAGPAAPLILIVDDHPLSARSLKDYLAFKGCRVELAGDGGEALRLAGLIHPDLIIMDVQMPGMDGLEAIRRLRALPDMKATPIIALTALAMPGDRDRTMEAGATEYVSKPARLEQLHKLIRSLLQRGGSS